MTELACIAPIPHLAELRTQKVHLCLMHLMGSQEYHDFYRWASDSGRFVILDNSQHEGYNFDIREIVYTAEQIGAWEIVIPDAVEDRRETVDRARVAFALMTVDRKTKERLEGLRPSFMVVPQGTSLGDWSRCARDLVKLYTKIARSAPTVFTKPLTIGLPVQYFFNRFAPEEMDSILDVLKTFSGSSSHILGWDKSPFDYVPYLIERHHFRSVDTSKPFSFALYPTSVPYTQRFRGELFFERTFTPEQLENARRNIDDFRGRVALASVAQRIALGL